MRVSLRVLRHAGGRFVVGLTLCLFIGNRAFAGSHSAQSGPITVDTRDDADVFKIVTAEGTTNCIMAVTWNAKSGTTYRVDVAGDLRGVWTNAPVGAGPEEQCRRTATSNGILRYLDARPGPITNRFYRVHKMP